MDWLHLHLALNHIPVIATPLLLLLLLWSWARRQAVTLRFCLCLFVVLAVASIAIKFTGDFAAEKGAAAAGYDKGLLERHEESADQASAGVFVMGLAAVLALVLSRRGRTVPSWSLGLLALFALLTCLLMARTANRGGQIRHPEIRPANMPSDAAASASANGA